MLKTVLLIEPTIRPNGVDYLKEHANVILAPDGSEETIIQYVNDYQAQAIIVRTETITAKIIESCPSLEVIGMHGVGLNHIDVQSATDNGVVVLNAPASNYTSVAEHACMFMLALSRNLMTSDAKVRENEWHYREHYFPMEINGKKLLIVGMGRVGQDLANKAKAFHLEVLGFDPFVSVSEMQLYGVKKIDDLNASLTHCDFVSLHAPLTKGTYHLFGAEQFQIMKNTAFVINLGRGPLIDEKALYKAIKQGQIAGAALDVLENEPPNLDNPLFTLDNVLFTPHFGGDTLEAKNRCSESITQDVIQLLQGKLSKNIANPQVVGRAKGLQKNKGSKAHDKI